MNVNRKKLVLIIMDGWGHGPITTSNAIAKANTPFIDSLYKKYPNAELHTSGEYVGLPDEQMGNSEVGHLNIGAGRIVYQDLVKIFKSIREKTLDNNPVLTNTFKYAKDNNKNIHFIGLLSNGGVHSHIEHLKALIKISAENNVKNFYVHAFTDGRDTDPKSGINFINELEESLKGTNGHLASLVGRYYAMDRDRRWERIKLAYDMLVKGVGKKVKNIQKAVEDSYREGITDEFIKPIVKVNDAQSPIAIINENDVVICFNFRTDRCRQITEVLTQRDIPDYELKKLQLYYVTMTPYDDTFQNVKVLFEKEGLHQTLGEVLSNNGKTQIRIAETEKYPHVTYFFSGGREQPFQGETRILIPSPKVATYDLKPSMSAYEVKDAIIKELNKSEVDFVCLNFANPDMVGHTGVFSAVVEAVETIDKCVEEVVEAGLKKNYSFIITADHGNAEFMINPNGSPNTAHTTNPVPIFLIDRDYKNIKSGKLADLAPTILNIMGIAVPKEMLGSTLV